jgi:hypothetical protein
MRTSRAAVISGLVFVGCNAISGVGEFTFDATDASGGGGVGGATSSSSSGTGGEAEGGGGEGGSGGAPGCDATLPCGSAHLGSGCSGCAVARGCEDDFAACMADPECQALLPCVEGCDAAACVASCKALHPTGVTLLDQLLSCIDCTVCAGSCTIGFVTCS